MLLFLNLILNKEDEKIENEDEPFLKSQSAIPVYVLGAFFLVFVFLFLVLLIFSRKN